MLVSWSWEWASCTIFSRAVVDANPFFDIKMTTSAVWFSHSAELRKHFWKQKVFWSSGYFVCSTGDASTETIAKYIAEQG